MAARYRRRVQEKGKGATFIVRLPLQNKHEAVQDGLTVNTSTNQTVALPLAGVHVLVVDDTDPLAFYQVALESSGATVTTASLAREAMGCFSRKLPPCY
jgi:chemotaxis protein histidine kinase CheA